MLGNDSINWGDFVHPQRFGGYFREIERHKSRNDCASYEAVYIAESVERKSPIGVPFADLYRVGQCWLEIEVVFVLFGQAHLNRIFLVEILDLDSGNAGEERVDSSGVNRDKLMLLEIAKFIQLEKGMSLRRVRSLVRLNSIKLFRNVARKQSESVTVPLGIFRIGDVTEDREVNVARRIAPSVRERELPSHLVQTGPETVQELSKFHSKHGIEGFEFKPLDVSSILRVVLSDHGVWFFHVSGHVPIKSVEVKLCPFRFRYQIPRGPQNHFRFPQKAVYANARGPVASLLSRRARACFGIQKGSDVLGSAAGIITLKTGNRC